MGRIIRPGDVGMVGLNQEIEIPTTQSEDELQQPVSKVDSMYVDSEGNLVVIYDES